MTTTPSPNQPFDPGPDGEETPDAVALEADDVTPPGSPEFDETHEPLFGKDAHPEPGAAAG